MTGGEAAKLKEITTLAGQTLALAAPGGAKVRIKSTGTRAMTAEVFPDGDESALVLGGKGTNAKSVRELAAFAAPCGCAVLVDLPGPVPAERRNVPIARARELDRLTADALQRVVGEWHRLLTGSTSAPRIRLESTESADVFIVGNRDLPSTAMGALRRIVGWICHVRGRIGFLEWEAAGH